MDVLPTAASPITTTLTVGTLRELPSTEAAEADAEAAGPAAIPARARGKAQGLGPAEERVAHRFRGISQQARHGQRRGREAGGCRPPRGAEPHPCPPRPRCAHARGLVRPPRGVRTRRRPLRPPHGPVGRIGGRIQDQGGRCLAQGRGRLGPARAGATAAGPQPGRRQALEARAEDAKGRCGGVIGAVPPLGEEERAEEGSPTACGSALRRLGRDRDRGLERGGGRGWRSGG